ncbi:unnamed protein product [Cylicocyclus nassatus]|uniref:F-box domain-containing protein n=1 Tax=Cylicocyclus nassatus TaxID=53992 RepID=A0AA36HEC9_CYLNA|nr:unnamed protein product [Cylicocyclus nassatus]
MDLPTEIIVEILKNVAYSDIKTCQYVNRYLNRLISENSKYLPRRRVAVRIFQKSGVTFVSNTTRHFKEEEFIHFKAKDWSRVAVDSLVLENIGMESCETQWVLQKLLTCLKMSRQLRIRFLKLDCVEISDSSHQQLSEFFRFVLPYCEEIQMVRCVLPTAPTPAQITSCKALNHYRLLDSRSAPMNGTNDAVLEIYTHDVCSNSGKKSFHAEMSCATPSKVCDFIQAWTSSAAVPYFNITLSECDEAWRSSFSEECRRRNISNACMEFASTVLKTAHVKVVFVNDAQLCRMWPVFDVPARNGPEICYNRYYRDF